jgi:NAD(P) transhydrogenase subunit alpha
VECRRNSQFAAHRTHFALHAMISPPFPATEWEREFISAGSRCNAHIYSRPGAIFAPATRKLLPPMPPETVIATFYVFILAAFLGYQVISRVPPLLHTPLMSATNAISGISLVGSLVTAGAHQTTVSAVLGFIAVVCSTTNVVGGFVITDRMLKMFKRKAAPGPKKDAD